MGLTQPLRGKWVGFDPIPQGSGICRNPGLVDKAPSGHGNEIGSIHNILNFITIYIRTK